jgi:hypothetical protein
MCADEKKLLMDFLDWAIIAGYLGSQDSPYKTLNEMLDAYLDFKKRTNWTGG